MAISPSSALQRPDLGQTFEEFDLLASRSGFVGSQVLPIFNVALQTANFSKIPIETLLEDSETGRASRSGYARSDGKFEQDNFATKEHGAEELVDDRERAIYAYTIDVERLSAARALMKVARNLERRIADAVFNATTWAGASLTTAVTNEWDDKTNATPIDDVHAAIQKVRDGSGLIPNALILDYQVYRNLRLCNQIVDRLKYWGGDDPNVSGITEQAIARALGIERLIVAGAQRNSADKGQTASLTAIWSGEYAMICRVASSPDLMEPCIGRTFHYTGDGSSEAGTVEMYREESKRSDVIRVRQETHEKVIYASAGHLLSNITTA